MKPNPSFILADWPAPKQVHAISTTRVGGRSRAPYNNFNLALHVGDDDAAVTRNRAHLKEILDLPGEPKWLNQVHGKTIVTAQAAKTDQQADGSYTQLQHEVCAVMTADCLPICLCDTSGEWVAVLHGGWRGLHAGIIEAGVATWPGKPGQCMAWLGPAIGPAAFWVRDDVRDLFLKKNRDYEACFLKASETHWHASLYEIARITLRKLGVTAIYGGDYCTAHDEHLFYSYRRDHTCGRMATLIWLA